MSFNWYKIAQVSSLQKQCIQNDRKLFSGVKNKRTKKISSQKINDIDSKHHLKYIGDRIKEGKKRESDIIEKINNLTGFILKASEEAEDIDGIDAFITGYTDCDNVFEKLTAQIKHRLKGGDDLGLEVIKGWPPSSADIRKISFNGKDMKTPVDYYFHIDRLKKLRIFNGKLVRDIAKKMSSSAIVDWGHHLFEGHRHEVTPYGEIVVVIEKGRGVKKSKNNMKVIAYLDTTKISPTFIFDL